MVPRSTLAATRVGLIEYLSIRTNIQWDYYRNLVLPAEGAKGAAFVTSINSLKGINYNRMVGEVQLQILVAHPDHQEAQCLLLDWVEFLLKIMESLKQQGLYGNYRGVEIKLAMGGCNLLDPIKLFVQDSDQRQDIPEGIALGTMQANYEFVYESSIELEQY
ncbi:hypothetical protein [Floridanema evergladense]|uniref:Uncharacterized protein n=1 Tax=Floridaenema evergladense BLCC-F167 TaxID=3153639 RepID=A0ABV4WD38_9CYAN